MIDEEALKNIEKLHGMKSDGIISDEEFEQAKQDLLKGKQKQRTVVASTATIPEPVEEPAQDNHLAWALLPIRRYVQFTGRSGRREFWMFLLGVNVIAFALAVIVTLDTRRITDDFAYTGTIGNLALGLLGMVAVAALLPYLAAQVRRFHDQGRPGWFALLNLLPYIGPLIVLGLMIVPGTEEDNEYGESLLK